MIRYKFDSTEARDNFADRFKLDSKVGDLELDADWHLLQFAKVDSHCVDYDEVAVLTAAPEANSKRQFIVQGNPSTFGDHASVVKDLGNGFYLVESTDGTVLGDHVDNIEHTSAPVTFLENQVSMTTMNGTGTDLDPLSADAQWHRIRVASMYRPLAKEFVLHDVTYQSKPEVYVMDSGINFNHPEFDYPSLEKENFYTLPAFNGNYADDVGHGTAVSSMICGKNLGLATHLKLMNVKIGMQGRSASLLELGEAIDAILAKIASDPVKTRIVNISWGVARSSWLDSKISALMDAGVTVVCAAGNSGISVEDISPAGMDDVITVGSIDKYDIPSGFNNISPTDAGITTGTGLSLDIFAPGENIVYANASDNGYSMGSGTSFSAPLVAGTATVIASLSSSMVPYSTLKKTVLDSATKNALLFEDARFSENQNNLVYLITTDPNSNYKVDNVSCYLGAHTSGVEVIKFNIDSQIHITTKKIFPDIKYTWSIEWQNESLKNKYEQFIQVDPETGDVTIHKPNISLPEDVKLEMVSFVGVATSSIVTMKTNNLFFFYVNPTYTDVTSADITLALTEINSVSYYVNWFVIK